MRHDCGLDRDLCSAVRPLRGGRERRAFERLISSTLRHHSAGASPFAGVRRRRVDNRHNPGIPAPRGVIARSVNGAAAAVPECCIQRQFICGDACCGVETSPMTTISKLLVACAAMTFAASQAGAGELLVTGPGGYRYRYGPPSAHGYGPSR